MILYRRVTYGRKSEDIFSRKSQSFENWKLKDNWNSAKQTRIVNRDRIIHHTSADVCTKKNRGSCIASTIHTCQDDECHFRQKISAGTLRRLPVPSRARTENFEGRFPALSSRWNSGT